MNPEDEIKLELPANYKYLNLLGLVLNGILERVEGLLEPEVQAYNLNLAVHEICTNIIQHAYLEKPGQRIWLEFYNETEVHRLIIKIIDTGLEYDPAGATDPDLEHGQIHGYGLFLARELLDEVTYERQNQMNLWKLVKNLPLYRES